MVISVLRRAPLVLLVTACGGERAADPPPESPEIAESGAGTRIVEEGRGGPSGLDEASARFLVAARFRAAGLRIVEDVALRAGDTDITLDGFDPARRVGYEYVAAEERAAARPAEITGARVLVIESADAAAIERAVDRFLAGLESVAEDEPQR